MADKTHLFGNVPEEKFKEAAAQTYYGEAAKIIRRYEPHFDMTEEDIAEEATSYVDEVSEINEEIDGCDEEIADLQNQKAALKKSREKAISMLETIHEG